MEEKTPATVLPEGLYYLKSNLSNPHARTSQNGWQYNPIFMSGYYLVRRFVKDTNGTLSTHPGIERATKQGEAQFDGILNYEMWPDAYLRLTRNLDPVVPAQPKTPVKLVEVTATVTITFKVQEGTNLEGAYVGIAADLMDVKGDLLSSSWDCDTGSITLDD